MPLNLSCGCLPNVAIYNRWESFNFLQGMTIRAPTRSLSIFFSPALLRKKSRKKDGSRLNNAAAAPARFDWLFMYRPLTTLLRRWKIQKRYDDDCQCVIINEKSWKETDRTPLVNYPNRNSDNYFPKAYLIFKMTMVYKILRSYNPRCSPKQNKLKLPQVGFCTYLLILIKYGCIYRHWLVSVHISWFL